MPIGLCRSRGDDLAQPPSVDTGIGCKFGVEAGAQDIALANSNNISRVILDSSLRDTRLGLVDTAGQLGEDGDTLSSEDLFDNRGADEDTGELRVGAKEGEVEGHLEAFDLAAKVVSVDADAEAADEFLAALLGGVCFVGQQDETGACTPDGLLLDPVGKECVRLAVHFLARGVLGR